MIKMAPYNSSMVSKTVEPIIVADLVGATNQPVATTRRKVRRHSRKERQQSYKKTKQKHQRQFSGGSTLDSEDSSTSDKYDNLRLDRKYLTGNKQFLISTSTEESYDSAISEIIALKIDSPTKSSGDSSIDSSNGSSPNKCFRPDSVVKSQNCHSTSNGYNVACEANGKLATENHNIKTQSQVATLSKQDKIIQNIDIQSSHQHQKAIGQESVSTVNVLKAAEPVLVTANSPPPRSKVIILGNSGVGKTSIIYNNKYGSGLVPCNATIGASYTNFDLTVKDSSRVQLQVWDTAGQERFRCMVPMYSRNANAVILVYDITDRSTFDEVDKWFTEIFRCSNFDDPIIILIGNKADQKTHREVTEGEGIAKALKMNAKFYEISAFDTQVIRSIFYTIAEKIYERNEAIVASIEDAEEMTEETALVLTSSQGFQLPLPLHDRISFAKLYGKSRRGGACCTVL